MKTITHSKKRGAPMPAEPSESELIALSSEDPIRAIELTLETEMPHLEVFEAFDLCFNAGISSSNNQQGVVHLPTATLFLDLKGRISIASSRACELLERPLELLRERRFTEFWRDRDRLRIEQDYLAHLTDASTAGRIHYLNLHTSGLGYIPVRLRTVRLSGEGALSLGQVAVTIESISAKEIVNRAIDRDMDSLTQFANSFPFPVFLKDVESRFSMVNDEFCTELGHKTPDNIIGKCDADFFPKKQARKYVADDNYVLSFGQILESTELHTPPGGCPIQVHVFKLPFYRHNHVRGVICMYWPVERRDYALGLLNFKG